MFSCSGVNVFFKRRKVFWKIMSKRSYVESFEDSDNDQEDYIVEELEKLKNKLNILRKNNSKKSTRTATSSLCSDFVKNEDSSLPSTSRDFNSSWFEPEGLYSNKDNIEEITIELDEGQDLPQSLIDLTETSIKETSKNLQRDLVPLDPQVEALLGKEGLPETKDDNVFHPSVANKWNFILIHGLSEDINEKLMAKYVPPSNCTAIVPPDLNPEIKNNLKKEALTRDDKQKLTQKQLSTILSALGQALTILLNTNLGRENILTLIESLSDAGRLLADVHFKTSTHRRYLILGMGFEHKIKNNIKDVLFNAPIDKYLFGKELSDNLEKAKTLERNSISILDSSNKFQKPNLNGKGPSQPQRVNRPVQRRRGGPPSRSYNRQLSSHQPVRAQHQFKTPRPPAGRQEKRDHRRY